MTRRPAQVAQRAARLVAQRVNDQPPDQQPEGRLRPTSPAAVTAWAVTGLVVGWLVHLVAERVSGSARCSPGRSRLLALVAVISGPPPG